MGSNLKLRSNVYPRQRRTPLPADSDFIRHVRGAAAVHKLLGMLGVTPDRRRHDDPEVLRLARTGKVTRAQLNTLRWAVRCAECECIPAGVTFDGSVAFRCEIPGCAQGSPPVRSVLIPDQLVREVGRAKNFTDIIDWAIARCDGLPPRHEPDATRTRVTVRVSPTTDLLYDDEDLSAFLAFGLRHEASR